METPTFTSDGDTLKIAFGGHTYSLQPDLVIVPEPELKLEPTPMPIRDGVLVSNAELMALPTSGAAWNAVLKVAKNSLGIPNLSDMNSSHDLKLVGCALAAVRLNDLALKTKAHKALDAAIGTEENIRWLELGRNLGGYVVAADVLDIRSGPVFEWLKSFMTKQHPHNNSGVPETIQENAWSSGSNASTQMGWVHAALSVYLKDQAQLEWGWMAFRRYVGDRTSTWKMGTEAAWQAIPADGVGIQNAGATKNGINIDGAIGNDMIRSNPVPVANLVYTADSQYSWVGLNGAVLAAEIFFRQGYPAYEVANKALLRAATYLHNLAQKNKGWYDTSTRKDVKFLINKRYGVNFPQLPDPTNAGKFLTLALPVGANGLVGFTDWIGS